MVDPVNPWLAFGSGLAEGAGKSASEWMSREQQQKFAQEQQQKALGAEAARAEAMNRMKMATETVPGGIANNLMPGVNLPEDANIPTSVIQRMLWQNAYQGRTKEMGNRPVTGGKAPKIDEAGMRTKNLQAAYLATGKKPGEPLTDDEAQSINYLANKNMQRDHDSFNKVNGTNYAWQPEDMIATTANPAHTGFWGSLSTPKTIKTVTGGDGAPAPGQGGQGANQADVDKLFMGGGGQ
jgi:hypothetical protein